jgi:N utilization substance protein A
MATTTSSGESELRTILDLVAREKGIDRKVLIESIESAIHKAAQRVFGATRELEARFNDTTGHVDLFQYMTVVEEVTEPERQISLADVNKHRLDAELGEELGFQVFWRPEDADKAREQDREYGDVLKLKAGRTSFGRIAAQDAKQHLYQRVRDAERDLIFNEFKDRKGELIRGIVRRFEKGNTIVVDLGKTEGILRYGEQTPRETYRPGDRIVALLKDINSQDTRGPQVLLSRSDPRLVEKLFEAEVPEIYEGIVRIVAVAREPGVRTKIAVTSRDADVDPVGACVGMKGARVQAVVQELRTGTEKIDIVPYDRDPARYVIAAIQPAEVHKVIVDESVKRMELVVPDEKLSLAIGRKGQNVRLASQLTGWKLDIISETRFRQMEDEAIRLLQRIEGVSDTIAKGMYRLGFRHLDEVADASVEELAGVTGVGSADLAARLKTQAENAMEEVRQEQIRQARQAGVPLDAESRLGLLRGVGQRTLGMLKDAGYRSVEELVRENEDQLALRTGLHSRKARLLKEAADAFLAEEGTLLGPAAGFGAGRGGSR